MHGDFPSSLAQAESTVEKTVDCGLSLVVRRLEDGAPVAFLFLSVVDPRTRVPRRVQRLHPGIPVVIGAINTVYEKALGAGLGVGSLVTGRTLHVDSGGTFPGHQGKGLGIALRLAAIEMARARGFNRLIVEAGHPATIHIWTKHCGFRALAAIDDLSEWRPPGKAWARAPREQLPLFGCKEQVVLCELTLRPAARDSRCCLCCWVCRLLCMIGGGGNESPSPPPPPTRSTTTTTPTPLAGCAATPTT